MIMYRFMGGALSGINDKRAVLGGFNMTVLR